MQLCEKLCKKLFHGIYVKDGEGNNETQNVQLISNQKLDDNPQKNAEIPTVNLIQSTPTQSMISNQQLSNNENGDDNNKSNNNDTNNSDTSQVVESAQNTDNPTTTEHKKHKETVHFADDVPLQEALDEINIESILLQSIEAISLATEGYDDTPQSAEEKAETDNTKLSTDDHTQNNETKAEENAQNKAETADLEEEDNEDTDEDETDDNSKRLANKYGDLGGELLIINIPNPRLSNCSLGLKLSGNKDLNKMTIYICNIIPNSLADIDGRLQIGDEILEVDDHILFGRSHLNASPLIKSCHQKMLKFVIHRSNNWQENMAVPVVFKYSEDSNSTAGSRKNSVLDIGSPFQEYSGKRKTSTVSLGHTSNIPHISTEETHTVYLMKEQQGLGFAIMEGSFTNEPGIFIKHLAPFGIAAQEGSLKPGDKLLSVNQHEVSYASYDAALELLKNAKGQVRLVVSRVRCSYSPVHSSDPPVQPSYQKRLSAPNIAITSIIPRSKSPSIAEEILEEPVGQKISIKLVPESESGLSTYAKAITETNARRKSSVGNLPDPDIVNLIFNNYQDDDRIENLEIKRDNRPLGMEVIGGSDTFIGDVIVHDIFASGVIAEDGRIKVGDKIIMIDDIPLTDKTNDEILIMLQSSAPDIKLKIRHQEAPPQDQDIYEVVTTIELAKKPSKGLGISVIGREGAKGVYICDIVKGGVADSDGRLQPGDQILEINGDDFRNGTQEQAATKLKCLMGQITFKIGRIQQMKMHYTPSYLIPKDESGENEKSFGKHLTANGPGHSPARQPISSPAHAR